MQFTDNIFKEIRISRNRTYHKQIIERDIKLILNNFDPSDLQCPTFYAKTLTCFMQKELEIPVRNEYNLRCENVPELIRRTVDARSYIMYNTYQETVVSRAKYIRFHRRKKSDDLSSL